MNNDRFHHLTKLLPDITPSRFLRENWCRKAYVSHGAVERLPELFSAPQLTDVRTLLASTNGAQVRVWFKDLDGINRPVVVSADQAQRLYASGSVTVVVDTVDPFVPAVATMMQGLARELATPMLGISCNVYGSPKGAGTRMHFDEQDSFLVQVQGAKRWRVARVAEIRHPTESYFGGALKPELAGVVRAFPESMPADAQVITLRPGSVLFLPRGTWHESETVDEHSLALTLTFASMTWADVVLSSLRTQLVRHERWRTPASRVLGAQGVTRNGQRRLRSAVRAARRFLAEVSLDGYLLERPASAPPTFERRRGVRLRFIRAAKGAELAISGPDRPRTALVVSGSYANCVARIVRKRGPFTLHELQRAGVGQRDAAGIVAYLIREGALAVRPPAKPPGARK